jgi:hypothetical protein
MMRVTVIEDPKPSQPKVNFKVGGGVVHLLHTGQRMGAWVRGALH